jgi:HK97 family phage portal protein
MGLAASVRASLRAVFSGSPRPGTGAWSPIVHEPYTGAWQANEELVRPEAALSNPTVYRCVSLIASDIGKLALHLVQVDANGVWQVTTSPAFSPVLRRPNAYQTIGQFKEAWMYSKLLYGNTFVLKVRDDRNVVVELHVLDPGKVKPMIGPDGAVYYELQTSDLHGIPERATPLVAPAREVIHDRMVAALHPLCGLSPLYACGGTARHALEMQSASTGFFAGGGRPSGIVMPLPDKPEIPNDTLARWKATWQAMGPAQTAFFGTSLKYEPIGTTAAEAQWIEQQGWTAKTIAGAFGVPISMVDSSQQPPYANSEASALQYHSQCLQTHLTAIEDCLDAGLDLPYPYGTEFDLDDLIWMDTATKTKAAHDAISAGALSPNEVRRKYFGLGPVPGGDTPYLQAQYQSLEAAAKRDFGMPAASPDADGISTGEVPG